MTLNFLSLTQYLRSNVNKQYRMMMSWKVCFSVDHLFNVTPLAEPLVLTHFY